MESIKHEMDELESIKHEIDEYVEHKSFEDRRMKFIHNLPENDEDQSNDTR
jgi:hypothetical protein